MGKLAKTVYAKGLFEFARENNCVKEFQKEIEFVKKTMQHLPKFVSFMENPRISKDEKEKFLEKVFQNQISNGLLGFLILVARKNHFRQLNGIFQEYKEQFQKFYNIGIAQISSPQKLSNRQKRQIRKRLLEVTNYQTIKLHYEVDPSLLGGIIIRMDGSMVDGSVHTKLGLLVQSLQNGDQL